ncbi:MAG: hypothetical protein IKB62_01565 [Oscillospiraceae bacterium]|nr:hypothetical protein [Oscillospiraceae bacterium]
MKYIARLMVVIFFTAGVNLLKQAGIEVVSWECIEIIFCFIFGTLMLCAVEKFEEEG